MKEIQTWVKGYVQIQWNSSKWENKGKNNNKINVENCKAYKTRMWDKQENIHCNVWSKI